MASREVLVVENMKRTQTSQEAPTAKKRKVLYSTYQKWQREFDRAYTIITWLGCKTEMLEGKHVVVRLNYSVCSTCKYKDRTLGRQDYSDRYVRWIVGADTSNIRDHAQIAKRCHVMPSKRRGARPGKVAPPIAVLQPLAACLTRRELFCDVSLHCIRYSLRKVNFLHFVICESRHDVKSGSAYKTEISAICFIAMSHRQELVHSIRYAKRSIRQTRHVTF